MMLFVITGPPAAGKSTVARRLARAYKESVYLPYDTINYFIVGGRLPPWDTSEKGIERARLNEEVADGIIERYLVAGYDVFLDGVFFPPDIERLRDRHGTVFACLLLPDLDALHRRDRGRPRDQQMHERVDIVHAQFAAVADNFPGLVYDTSNQKPRQMVDEILGIFEF